METSCHACVSLSITPSLQAAGFRCGWAGRCQLGRSTGPASGVKVDFWRFSAVELSLRDLSRMCAGYRPCSEQTRCGECTNSFESSRASGDCYFCLDAAVPVDAVGAGGGTCAKTCRSSGSAVGWTNRTLLCPVMPAMPAAAESKQLASPRADSSEALPWVSTALFALFLLLLAFLAYKLSS